VSTSVRASDVAVDRDEYGLVKVHPAAFWCRSEHHIGAFHDWVQDMIGDVTPGS
jgi:hypothetical protein